MQPIDLGYHRKIEKIHRAEAEIWAIKVIKTPKFRHDKISICACASTARARFRSVLYMWCFVLQDSKTTYNWAILPFSGTNVCLKHQFLSKYSIIFAKVAGCFVPRGVDRLDAIFVYLASGVLKTAPRARLEPSLRAP